MTAEHFQPHSIHSLFVRMASELSNHFPTLDLWFNLEEGTSTMRYGAAEISPVVLELTLNLNSVERLCSEAILSLKDLARLFDS